MVIDTVRLRDWILQWSRIWLDRARLARWVDFDQGCQSEVLSWHETLWRCDKTTKLAALTTAIKSPFRWMNAVYFNFQAHFCWQSRADIYRAWLQSSLLNLWMVDYFLRPVRVQATLVSWLEARKLVIWARNRRGWDSIWSVKRGTNWQTLIMLHRRDSNTGVIIGLFSLYWCNRQFHVRARRCRFTHCDYVTLISFDTVVDSEGGHDFVSISLNSLSISWRWRQSKARLSSGPDIFACFQFRLLIKVSLWDTKI